jgi:hypothetical protein
VKRFGIPALLALSLILSAMPTSSAAVIQGSKCSKVGDKQTFNGLTFTCKKSGSQLLWSQGVKEQGYNATFAKSHLAEAQAKATKILEDAKVLANQISSPPNCTISNSRAFSAIGSEDGRKALVFDNPGQCELVVRASAVFFCDGAGRGVRIAVTSTGMFPLRAGSKLLVSFNYARYFPQVLNDCELQARGSSSLINISSVNQNPSVMVLSSRYTGAFNQVEASRKADQIIKSAKLRADKIIADAKNPTFILKAWKVAVEAKAVAAAEAAAATKIESDKVAQDAGLGKKCVPGTSCLIGSTGPGGGVVFYDAGSQQDWGRYLEFAPKDWYGTKYVDFYGTEGKQETWCNDNQAGTGSIEDNLIDRAIPGTEIGAGKANTDSMLTGCSSKTSAATTVRAYQGGGLGDWYLPSKAELNELCKYANRQNTGNPKIRCEDGELRDNSFLAWHWSSSEYDSVYASMQYFGNGNQLATAKKYFYVIRPIRAF